MRVGLPWPSLLAFVRIRTHPRVYELGANHVPDAHLAALAIEHGVGVCSADTDFARFPGLRWVNPLDA